jgi:hypothetical protein
MVNEIALDAPPPVEELNTVTAARPTSAVSLAGIAAVRWEPSTKVVVRFWPFQRTTVDEPKPAPVTPSVKSAPGAFVVVGEMEVIDGCCDAPMRGTRMSQTLRP